jgi:hypothetical protein
MYKIYRLFYIREFSVSSSFDVIIILMKSLLGKYFYPCLISIIIEIIVVFVVLIEFYSISNGLADSIHSLFIGNEILRSIFVFVSDWAIILAILPFIVILSMFITDIRKARRRRALNRIHDWAQNTVLILSDYRQRDSSLQKSPLVRYEGIKMLMGILKQHSGPIILEAKTVNSTLESRTQEVIRKYDILGEKIDNHDESVYNDLKVLQHDLAGIMMSTFELLQ